MAAAEGTTVTIHYPHFVADRDLVYVPHSKPIGGLVEIHATLVNKNVTVAQLYEVLTFCALS